jgi:hypothetical protein
MKKRIRISTITYNDIIVNVDEKRVDEFIDSFRTRYDDSLFDGETGDGVIKDNTDNVDGEIETYNDVYDVEVELSVE